MAISIGLRLGNYEIVTPIGAGGMGEVWLARNESLGRNIALKLFPENFEPDPEHDRFEREARVLASLTHNNIATISAGRYSRLPRMVVAGLLVCVTALTVPVVRGMFQKPELVDAINPVLNWQRELEKR